jgi:hypothetical protein
MLKWVAVMVFGLMLINPFSALAQFSVSATYTAGDILSEYNTAPSGPSSCPGFLTVNIPTGAAIVITGVNVSYSVTATGGGWLSEQRSRIRCTNAGGISESVFYSGSGTTGGTWNYNRTGLNIANGVAGGGAINFAMDLFRTWGGSGCNTSYQYVNNGTWTVTVQYIVNVQGDVEGYVFNGQGLAISGAFVGIQGAGGATTGPNGYYYWANAPAGNQTMYAFKQGYNLATQNVNLIISGTTQVDWLLTRPNLTINPLLLDETLNPNEYLTRYLGMLNTGDGPVEWEAEIEFFEPPYMQGNTTINPVGHDPLTNNFQPNGQPSIGPGNGEALEDGSRDLMACPDGSIFSIPIVGSNNGYTSTLGTGYKVYQQFGGLTKPIRQVTFWAIYTGAPPAAPTFKVEICQPGSVPGAVVTSVTAPITAVNTGVPVIGYATYVFTVEVPATALADGWVGVEQQTASPTFYWLNTTAGAGYTAYQQGVGNISGYRVGLCLSGGGGGWLTLDDYDGLIPGGGASFNLATNFNATGFEAGDIATANIQITTSPNVGTFNIPVTMRVAGPALLPVDNLTAVLINQLTGQVNLSWTFASDITFEYFLIKRNGVSIGTTTNQFYTNFLPGYGTYDYTVSAVYAEGQTVPAGPVTVEWLIPDLCYAPASPINYQWPNRNEPVLLTLENCGQGLLAFTFPEYAALQLLNNPDVKKNNTTVTPDMINASNLEKGSVAADGTGQPVVLGAGGPDNFGSVWIDSDEAGGPTFNWIEISGVGTDHFLTGDDNNVVINLPFVFPFYDAQKTSLRASTNGYLTFGATANTFTNQAIPTTAQPTDLIAPFWDDLNFTGAAKLYSWYDAVNNYFIIQYSNVPRLGATALNTFQVILYPTGAIKFQYLSMTGVLNSATVGIENQAGNDGLQISFNTTYVKNNLAVFISVPSTFIIDVNPAFGTIASGQTKDVIMTYSSIDYSDPGTYNQDLLLETNELAPGDVHLIPNTMVVYTPGRFVGNVTDCNTGAPINQVYVTAVSMFGSYQTSTNANGNYAMYVDEDVYDVIFEKLGMTTVVVADTFAQAGIDTPVSVVMCEFPYPPAGVIATVIDNDTKVRVDWMLPEPVYEIVYDDGVAEDYAMWLFSGNANAVRFTPSGYPVAVMGGRIFVGDGSFPANANFLGSKFGVAVHAADGPNGLPGTTLDSIEVTVTNYGWVTFYGLNATIESGNFYIAMYQGGVPPNAAPIGVDLTPPTVFRSYSKAVGGPWAVSAFQDFMMRAIVSSPILTPLTSASSEVVIPTKASQASHLFISQNGTPALLAPGVEQTGEVRMVEGMNDERGVVNYQVARVSSFNPAIGETPWNDGTLTILATTTNLTYTDNGYTNLPMGWYAYAVRAKYTNNEYSVWAYSNLVPRLLDVAVTINVTCCNGATPDNAEVTLTARNYPFTNYFAVTDETGVVVFDSVFKGFYDLKVEKVGFQIYMEEDIYTFANWSRDVVLGENAYAPRNYVVDPLTSIATWDPPLIIKLIEDFEGAQFPPLGWQKFQAQGPGWERKEGPTGGADWPVPAGDGFFALVNDDAAGSTNDGSMDYLITPPVDLRESDDFFLYFDQYYTATWGSSAYVEYSTDGGANWEVLQTMSPSTGWNPVQINLAAFSGLDGERQIWFAFHHDDNGAWADGWGVDNVEVSNGVPVVQSYYLYLNDGFVAEVPADVFEYQYQDLTYGQIYTGAVAARYSCGLSPKVYFTWQSSYLYPPRNLYSAYLFNTNEVPLLWNPPIEGPGIYAPVFTGEIIPGNYAPSTGAAPINAVPVEGYTEEALGFENFRGSIMHGIKNNAPAQYISVDIDVPGVLTPIANWPGAGFSNATEFKVGSTEIMYEIDNAGGARAVNVTTGVVTALPSTVADVTGMAKDPVDGVYYLCTGGGMLYTWNDVTSVATPVGTLSGANLMIGITCDKDGNLWGYDIGNDQFYSINKATGACTTIGPIGFDANFGQGLGYDQATEQIIMSAYNNTAGQAQLRVVNPATGNSTLIGALGPGGTQVASICAPMTAGGGPGGGDVPDGLLGFNVYRDGTFIVNVPYNGQGVDEWIQYIDNVLMPGTYYYSVTALYDLGVYGFPGQIGESMFEGPIEVEVVYGFDLPFYEDFSSGTFSLNEWTASGANWRVNGQAGNIAPSAEFTWDPLIENGNSALRSYPLLGYGMTEGDIWLDFDVKLNDRFATGEEKLKVEVFNGMSWNTVYEFANNGSFNWTSYHIKITDHAMGKVFMVRFNANCKVSSDIVSWFVDNVAVYRVCASPEDLTGVMVNANGIKGNRLGFVAPEVPMPIAEWIHWDSGTNFSGIGLTSGGTFTVAARWDAGQLNQYNGTSITKVRIFPQDDGFGTLTVKVWKGANAGTLLASKVVTSPVVGIWNEVTLNTPITLDVASELWVGYTIGGQVAGKFPAGTDAGPAVTGYGDMISLDGISWDALSEIAPSLSYNWNVQAYVEELGYVSSSTPLVDDQVYNNTNTELSRGQMKEVGVSTPVSSERMLGGFNIYRSVNSGAYELYDFVPYVGTPNYTYLDSESEGGLVIGSTYCYKVTAVWESATDYCESPAALAAANPNNDFVCILWTSVNSLNESMISVYPNPARDQFTVSSGSQISRISVINYVGQVVYDAEAGGQTKVDLNTAGYEAGVYMVKIATTEGIVTKRVTIVR